MDELNMTEAEVLEAAKKAAGNHKKFGSFCWMDEPEDSDRWTLVYTHNRDSELLYQSNAEQIDERLSRFIGKTVICEHHGHWACGWVEGYAIKVFLKDGKVSKAFREWLLIKQELENYPVLNEEDLSRREYEATLENIRTQGRRIETILPDGWEEEVFGWLWDNDQREVDPVDGGGGWPSEAAVFRAVMALAEKDDKLRSSLDQDAYEQFIEHLIENGSDWLDEWAREIYRKGPTPILPFSG